jgi:hypothetical protein
MSEEKQHFSNSGSDFFSDDTIRLFLLGRLRADEQARFEERLLLDDEMERRVRRVEYELADDYAFGRLRIEEREPFAQNFLVTEERRQKLAVSEVLRKELSQLAGSTNAAQTRIISRLRGESSLFGFYGFGRTALSFASAFVALLIFSGLVWLVMKGPRSKMQPVVAQRQPVPSGTREYAHAPSQTPQTTGSPTPTPQTTEMPGGPGLSPLIATFVLPKAQREGGESIRITIPPGANDIVRLELSLESADAATYRAELFTGDGKSIMVAPELRASSSNLQAKVVLDVPVRLLKVGDYQIALSRTPGSVKDVGRYYFRALEKTVTKHC